MQESRLFKIVYHLLDKGRATAPELAEKFEVSVRTIYRDIDALSGAGIPIYAEAGRNGGIYLMNDFILDKAVLKYFAKEIEKRIGVQTDTTAIDKELANYESKLKEVDLNKARLEREIDNLPIDARFRERKIHDMTLRLDALYDTIVELEERIEDAKLRKSSIEMETITLDNIYKLMLNFGKLYDIISDEEKKSLITYLIKEIQIYPNGESEQPLKSIEFNFPIYRDGQEVRRLLWEKGNTVETVVLLCH
jgi:site-specific DNA recombinase